MINKKTLDDLELVFLNEEWTEEERKSFSAFLKARKMRLSSKKQTKMVSTKQKMKNEF